MTNAIEIKNGDLSVVVTPAEEDVKKILNHVINELCSQVSVRGFRKGKAPLEVARKYLSQEEINEAYSHTLLDRCFKSIAYDAGVNLSLEGKVAQGAVPQASFAKDGSSVTFTYPLLPVIETLGNYKGIKTDVKAKEVTDQTVEDELKKIAQDESDLTPTEEPIANGFTANCDVRGSIAGVERSELTEKGFDIKVGGVGTIPGLSDKLLGHKVGDNIAADLVMPANYPDDLGGKTVHFDVRINSVKKVVTPEINDELATLQTQYEGAENLEQLKAKIREKQTKDFAEEAENERLNKILTECNKGTKYTLDEARLKDAIVNNQRQKDEKMLSQNGLDLPAYLKLIGMDLATYGNNVYHNTLSQIESTLLRRAIAKAELPAPTADEIKEQFKKFGQDYDKIVAGLTQNLKSTFKNITDEQVKGFIAARVEEIADAVNFPKLRRFLLDNND